MEQNNQARNHRLHNPSIQIGSCVGITMLQINIRGINRFEKLDSLCIFLQNLKIAIDVLVVGETWIKNSRSMFYNIPGYKSTYSCRNGSSGGLAVFVREGINFAVKGNTTDNGYHHLQVEISAAASRVMLHGIYRPPVMISIDFFLLWRAHYHRWILNVLASYWVI